MKEHPILFSGPMVRALLDGSKTQTRRVVKLTDGNTRCSAGLAKLRNREASRLVDDVGLTWRPFGGSPDVPMPQERISQSCPHGAIGDSLWVREKWATSMNNDRMRPRDLCPAHPMFYFADSSHGKLVKWNDPEEEVGKVRPSIFMPRWACRLILEITDIRVERLQDISEDDAEAEGVSMPDVKSHEANGWTFCDGYRALWDSLNAKRGLGWDINPFVWCITFKKI